MFEITKTRGFNKDVLTDGFEYDYVTRTSQNQGILQTTGFVNKEHINPAGVWSFGLLQMDFFYRYKPWYAGQFVRQIIPNMDLTKNSILYMTALLNKQKEKLLSVLVRDVDSQFKNTIVTLPVKNSGIDFDFMESFIEELEAEHLRELEMEHVVELDAYLHATGLKDYNLSQKEQQVLEEFKQDKIDFKEYCIEDCFEIKSYAKCFDANKVNISDTGDPYVVRSSLNNGIRGYINEHKKYLNEGNTISFGQDTATMFYQEKPYFTGDKIKIIKSKNKLFNKENALFFIATMTKAFSFFTWGTSSFNINIIKNKSITLPVKNNKPDYEIMETFMSIIKKLVIKDIMLYKEKKISTTKTYIENNLKTKLNSFWQ